MAAAGQISLLETLLADIPGPSPAGSAMPDRALFEIERARHSQDAGGGVWEREAIEPDWPLVLELTSAAIAGQSKHMRLAAWFTEANTQLHKLPGFTEGLRLITGLIERFWDRGLLPAGDDGDYTSRATPIEGLNDRVSAVLNQLPLTKRSDTGPNYCFPQFQQSIRAGFEENLRDANGVLNAKRKEDREALLAAGGVTGEMWSAAVKSTKRDFYETRSTQLNDARESMAVLMKLMDEQRIFGPNDAPSLKEVREVLEGIQGMVAHILKDKRKEEPDKPPPVETQEVTPEQPQTVAKFESQPVVRSIPSLDLSWDRAQSLILSGNVRAGLDEMTALAAQEHGRNRFLRKLALAELCLRTQREALAVIILEELTEQIKTLNLSLWESPELIGRVWGQLYRRYRLVGDEKKVAASELYLNLCRLDPWQGLRWSAD